MRPLSTAWSRETTLGSPLACCSSFKYSLPFQQCWIPCGSHRHWCWNDASFYIKTPLNQIFESTLLDFKKPLWLIIDDKVFKCRNIENWLTIRWIVKELGDLWRFTFLLYGGGTTAVPLCRRLTWCHHQSLQRLCREAEMCWARLQDFSPRQQWVVRWPVRGWCAERWRWQKEVFYLNMQAQPLERGKQLAQVKHKLIALNHARLLNCFSYSHPVSL